MITANGETDRDDDRADNVALMLTLILTPKERHALIVGIACMMFLDEIPVVRELLSILDDDAEITTAAPRIVALREKYLLVDEKLADSTIAEAEWPIREKDMQNFLGAVMIEIFNQTSLFEELMNIIATSATKNEALSRIAELADIDL